MIIKFFLSFITVMLFCIISCADNTESKFDDENFGCEIINPSDKSVFKEGTWVQVEVKTYSEPAEVLKTTLFIDNMQVVQSEDSLISYSWSTSGNTGTIIIKAETVNQAGESSENSIEVQIDE